MENQTLKTRHHDRISSNRSDEKIKDPEQELQKAKQINDKYKKAYTEVVREYEKAVAKIENLEQTVAEDQLYRDKITREYTSVKEPLSALQNRYKAANDEMVKIEKELSESKSRLSRMMGNKLGDNNPDIADLSDKNRPTKLAEKNTELYDNEWTDAYEVFLNHYKTEKQTIEKLLEMLQDIKSECDKITKEQELKLTEALKLKRSAGSVPDHVFKQLKDFRRFTAEESLPEVIEICLRSLRYKSYTRFLKSTDVLKFFKGCVELCWLMNVQDPPLVFGDTPMKNDQFDVNYFKFYTSTGSNFEYTVWPALLLKKDGAILSKGVAQASSEQKAESQRRKTRNAEAARNGTGSVSNERIWDERKDKNLSDKNPTTKYLYHNNRFSQSHEDKNYKQSVAGGPEHFTDKKTFSQRVKAPGSTTVAARMSRNIGSRSQRESESSESESGNSRKQVRSYRSNYSDLVNMYGINSPEVKLLEIRLGIQSTESDV
ncbi:uncharacterized protein LOC132713721 [Ruditapes philippinarum]|uniref:uncharacterized protein LOC132713721 n=1 Tax=Ruditapes philippinarum TaxID=129788 RepID=UPI00295ADA84|nr:uncharacterized protein LOC132713721 [Ruditapes philippinarum]